ncbi:MAG: ATP-binding cassette domain-containing protein [Proteobacteria bacterium]|nr:ATP-binding cassette domain-containing protein [Pseudomonadota bacterium]
MNLAGQLDGVGYQYAKARAAALTSISAQIPAGRITGIVGPDGAGKTTLIRLMSGLLKPSTGNILTDGLEPLSQGAELRRVLGYMPQKFGLYEDLTVLENLALYADLRGVPLELRRSEFERLLSFTDLAAFTSRLAGNLSGGMKQKLGLACVLLGTPRILLLDEPSVGVDPISRRELWQMVTVLAENGLSVVWSTSYLDEAERCGHILLMNAGQLLYAGSPAELTETLRGRSFQIAAISGDRRAVLQRRSGSPPPSVEVLIAGASAQLEPVEPRLEDAFMDILGGGPGGDSEVAKQMSPAPVDAAIASAIIEAEGLTKNFGTFTAADRISFKVPQGEIFGLLGPNGAGKSTTFKMLCGLLVPSAGRARVMGIDLKVHAPLARQRLGYMAQKFSLYGNLTVQQNLEFFAGAYGLRGSNGARKIREMHEAFGLGPFRSVPPNDLALGYKQRLALACALMHNPDVLFLDEPTSGVDPITRREFWAHINGVVQKGVTVMVTTHFMDEAEYCDRIGLVYRGQLIAVGPPDELKKVVASSTLPDPTMEDAFIALIERHQLLDGTAAA